MARWWLWDEYPYRLVDPTIDLWLGGPNADGRGLDAANGGYSPAPGLQITSASVYSGGVGPLVRENGSWVGKLAGRLAQLHIGANGAREFYGPAPAGTNRLYYSSDLTGGYWGKRGSVTVSYINGWSQIRGLGALGVADVWQPSVVVNGTKYAVAFLLRRVSTSGTLRIYNPSHSDAGEWLIDLAALGPGEHLITRRHQAVTVVREMTRHNGTNVGIHFTALSGTIDIDVRACTVVDIEDYNWFAPIETGSSTFSLVAEQLAINNLNMNNFTIAVRRGPLVTPSSGARMWSKISGTSSGQYINNAAGTDIALYVDETSQYFTASPGNVSSPVLYWAQRRNGEWWQGRDDQPLTAGAIGNPDWSSAGLLIGGTSYGSNHFQQPLWRVLFWPRLLSAAERAYWHSAIVAAESGS